ncbi:MAG: hypothetical protein ABI467_17255 [Kofleriaceae bacterium]
MSVWFAAACGGGGDDTTTDAAVDVGFNLPTATLKANASDAEVGDVDLTSCLADAPTTVAHTLATTVKDFQNQTAVPQATVTGFPGIMTDAVFDTQMSDGNGLLTINIPAGTKRYGFKMTADGQFPTFLLNQYVKPDAPADTTEPSSIQSVSNSTAALLPALIGQTRTPGTGVVAGAVRDCQGHEISNFVVTVSSTSMTSTPIPGAQAFYFSLSPELPVHHTQADSAAANGLFMAIQLPVTATAYVQAWGFPTAADLASGTMKLISELAVPVVGDTVVTGSFEPIHN